MNRGGVRSGPRWYGVLALCGLGVPWFAPYAAALTPEETIQLVPKLRLTALRYRGQLPNFICIQQTVRRENSSGEGKKWQQLATIEEEVTFNGPIPAFKLLSINGKQAKPGAVRPPGLGDPGLLAQAIVPTWVFGPRSQAVFQWIRSDMLNGTLIHVLSYQVPRVVSFNPEPGTTFNAGFHGTVYVAQKDLTPLRLEVQPDFPEEYAFPGSSWSIDYAPVTIGDRQFTLPSQLVVQTRSGRKIYENTLRFSGYRQYAASSSIVVDEGQPR